MTASPTILYKGLPLDKLNDTALSEAAKHLLDESKRTDSLRSMFAIYRGTETAQRRLYAIAKALSDERQRRITARSQCTH